MQTAKHPMEPEEVMAYLDGELAPERASRVVDHLATCQECQALAEDLRGVSDRMMAWRVEAPALRPPREVVETAEVRKPRWYMRKPVWALAICVPGVVFLLAVGVSLSPQYSKPAAHVRAPVAQTQQAPMSFMVAPPKGPLIVHSANLSLVARNFDMARGAIEETLKRHHGYVAEMTVNAEESSARTLNASVRTPDPELDATISELKSLGRVVQEGRTGEEVTQQSIDLDARLANARASEQRLTELLKRRTDNLADVLAVEEQISKTRGEIEQMEAERKNLDRRIQFAKLDLRVTEVYQAQLSDNRESTTTRLRNAAVEGYKALGESVLGAASFALSAGPVILIWCAVLFFPVRYVWRRLRR